MIKTEDILKVSDVFVHNESPLGSNIQFIIWINTGLEQHTVQIENIWQEILFQSLYLISKFNCYVPFLSSNLLYSQAISPPDFCSAWRMSKWRMFIFRWTILLSLRLSLQGDTSLDNLATVPLYAAPQTSCTWHGCVELTGSMKNLFPALMKNKTSSKGASVYVSRHTFLADLCNMLWCLWLPQSALSFTVKEKVLALKTVVRHRVMHADGWMGRWGGTVH